VIVSGSVKIYQKAQDGREKILCVLGPAEFFGEFSLVEGQPRSGQRPHASAHGDALYGSPRLPPLCQEVRAAPKPRLMVRSKK
jgi:hypothetical protein